MTAVDPNVLVRLLTGDDVRQAAAVRALFESGPIWIGKTVLLETACVLRSTYELSDDAIVQALIALLRLRNVHMEDRMAVLAALKLTEGGLEWRTHST